MSVQFGRWNFCGQPIDPAYLERTGSMLAPYGPDREGAYIKDGVGLLFRAFHTTKESRQERQPLVSPSGTVTCWDGRLDNREELIRELRHSLTPSSTDVDIVVAAYASWGTRCFARFIGDWALSIWDPASRAIFLAKDPIGTRHLYYSFDQELITWSTILDPLVLLAGKTFALEEEYIAGWLSFFPATHLTPYVGIHSVPPSCFVTLKPSHHSVVKYWDFDPSRRIRYRTDGEYEEHFRQVFGESIRRRLRSDSPVLAELSGGMDSSSVVCMADAIIGRGEAATPRLDTVSYYDDSEPNWNERPYFTKIEEKRGRKGCHIDVGRKGPLLDNLPANRFMATPDSKSGRVNEDQRQFVAFLASRGNRVLLSGIGGDEVTGGVPTPTPELADLLARIELTALAHQLKLWALQLRKPWFHLLCEATSVFFPPALMAIPKYRRPATWLTPGFVRRYRAVFQGYEIRVKLLAGLPTFQMNVATLQAIRRQLACYAPSSEPPIEKRYPFLDRSLLEFLSAVPRDQLVRPGQRRSLLRRALAGIVPDEVLNRRRKAYVARGPLAAVSAEWRQLAEMTKGMVSGSLGIVDPSHFGKALQEAHCGRGVPTVAILRTLIVESWLRRLVEPLPSKGAHSAVPNAALQISQVPRTPL